MRLLPHHMAQRYDYQRQMRTRWRGDLGIEYRVCFGLGFSVTHSGGQGKTDMQRLSVNTRLVSFGGVVPEIPIHHPRHALCVLLSST